MHAQLRAQWCRSASARSDAGAGSRLRARAGSSPASSLTARRAGDRVARSAAVADHRSNSVAAAARQRCGSRSSRRNGARRHGSLQSWSRSRHYRADDRTAGNPDASLSAPGGRATPAAVPRVDTLRGSSAGSDAPARRNDSPRRIRAHSRRAVLVAAVAAATDAHLLRAAPATVQPIALLARPHAPRTPRWTTPRNAGIKEARTRPCAARV